MPLLLPPLLTLGPDAVPETRPSVLLRLSLCAAALAAASALPAQAPACDAGLTVPAGFCAQVVADRLGAARHVVVASNGDVLINANPSRGGAESGTGSGPGGGLVLLRDTNGDGKADLVRRLGGRGGTGIAVADGYLWATDRNNVVRYRFAVGDTVLGAVDTILGNLPTGGHTAYNFVVRGRVLYLNVGSRSNSCQAADRQTRSMGVDPCIELEGRAGIWRFDAHRPGQTMADGRRFASGIRNAVALAWNEPAGELWAVMHGRDQLAMNWGFSDAYNAENPGEELLRIREGDDFGWPYCYHSMEEKKLVLAPEYGGDGKQVGRCATKKPAVYAFPGHWAPNALLFYTGRSFPSAYRNGAFVVFHGSWNRAPLVQDGFKVSFVPLRRGKAAGAARTFADGFASEAFKGNRAAGPPAAGVRNHRPTGIAQAPDGSIYITDDLSGTVYRISYQGK
ncbi:MAG: PQQ-dependent sugar dehydrogenase [Gemmatimonadetes bacterium]|nr:PQQ-dependent sugar dehydrogenase [Gemmatimonadota bacterium]